jgi:hypothetical protein
MAGKINKKTRNVISGILVSIASVYAVINFADIPAQEVRYFITTTLLFFSCIVILALIAVVAFKLLAWLKSRLAPGADEPWVDAEQDQEQDSTPDDKP